MLKLESNKNHIFKINISKYNILYWIIVLIGCQQFPALNITGSTLKIYDILSAIIGIKYRIKINDTFTFLVFLLFVIAPTISTLYGYFIIGYPDNFFIHYASERKVLTSLKFNYYFFPLFQLIFMYLNFICIVAIYQCDKLYENINKLIRSVVIGGTIISILSILALMGLNIINIFPSFLNGIRFYATRNQGFSIEPGNYILYQTWVTLFAIYSKRFFSKKKWKIIMGINLLSLLLTFSSGLSVLLVITCCIPFIFKSSIKTKLSIIISLIIIITVTISILKYYDLYDIAYYTLYDKLANFFEAPHHTLDSGAFRSYTTRLGFEIWKDFPILGVGYGMSLYHIHAYDSKLQIIQYGEILAPGIQPQNSYSLAFAEMGIIGGSALIIFLLIIIYRLWKCRNDNSLCKFFLIGALFNIAILNSLYPLYSLYLWVFLTLGFGYCKRINIKSKD